MKFLIENWQTIAGILGFLGAPLAYFLGKKKANAETNIVRGDAIDRMQTAYDGFVEDSMKQYNSLKEKVSEIEGELQITRKENIQQRDDIRELRKAQEKVLLENQVLKKHISEWESKYKSLKAAFERLKKKYDDKVSKIPDQE